MLDVHLFRKMIKYITEDKILLGINVIFYCLLLYTHMQMHAES